MKKLFVLLVLFPLAAGASDHRLGLAEWEKIVVDRSARIDSARHLGQAGRSAGAAQHSRLWPTLSLEGYYRHLSEVPTIQPSPLSPSIKLGDNANYSLGPQLQWLVFDSGAIRGTMRSLDFLALAREEERAAIEQEVRLSFRRSYLAMVGSLEQVRLKAGALRLAQAQEADVSARYEAGAASRQDSLHAQSETLEKRRDFRQAQTELGSALRVLFSAAGVTGGDFSRPLPEDVAGHRPRDVLAPTYVFEADGIESLKERFEPVVHRPLNDRSPRIMSLARTAQAAREAVRGTRAGWGPQLTLSARSSRDYPNGPRPESFTQNAVGAAVRWPFFEGGRVVRETEEKSALASEIDARRRQAEEDLRLAFDQARDRWAGLAEEESLQRELIGQKSLLADMVYGSYTAGRSTFLEVEAANLSLLQAQLLKAKTDVDMLNQLAILDCLGSVEK